MRILNHYTCAQIFQRLDDYLDRELSPAEIARVEEHLQACAVCAAEFAFEDEVLRQVRRKLRQLAVPEDLVARILAQLPSGAAPGG